MGLTFTDSGAAGGGAAVLTGIAPGSAGAKLLDAAAVEGARLAAINGQDVADLAFDSVIGLLQNATRPTTLELLTTRVSAFDAFAQFS